MLADHLKFHEAIKTAYEGHFINIIVALAINLLP